jgi:hypothetical protein
MSICAGWLCQKLRDAERDTAARPPRNTRGPLARAPRPLSSHAWSVGRALADREGVGVWAAAASSRRRPVNVLLQAGDGGRESGHRLAFDLRLARPRRRGSRRRPGETAHGLAEHAVVVADEAHVAIVELRVHGTLKRNPMPLMKSRFSSPSKTMVCNTRSASLPA